MQIFTFCTAIKTTIIISNTEIYGARKTVRAKKNMALNRPERRRQVVEQKTQEQRKQTANFKFWCTNYVTLVCHGCSIYVIISMKLSYS